MTHLPHFFQKWLLSTHPHPSGRARVLSSRKMSQGGIENENSIEAGTGARAGWTGGRAERVGRCATDGGVCDGVGFVSAGGRDRSERERRCGSKSVALLYAGTVGDGKASGLFGGHFRFPIAQKDFEFSRLFRRALWRERVEMNPSSILSTFSPVASVAPTLKVRNPKSRSRSKFKLGFEPMQGVEKARVSRQPRAASVTPLAPRTLRVGPPQSITILGWDRKRRSNRCLPFMKSSRTGF